MKKDKKDHILEVAEKLFSELGYDATTTRQIAGQANVNMAMLNYYFGSKDGLYKAVLQNRITGFRQTLLSITGQPVSSRIKLDQAVDVYVDRVMENKGFHRLIQRELSLTQRSEISDVLTESIMINVNEIKRILNDGIEEGVFRQVDVEMTIATIFGTKYYVVNSVLIASRLLGKDLTDPQVVQEELKPRLKRHLKDLLNAHLAKHDTQA
ncbi:MAG TPA: TetR/AcrR family transcriptional regulator [Sphingobacteriaceae bacterium]